eukprot:4137788-Ditylum_brightwellii.AAC.1
MFYKRNTLSSNHIQQLNSIGFIWDHLEHAWNERFDQLCTFKAQHGHCLVFQYEAQYTTLGRWVNQQRESYKKNTLSASCIEQLNSIGFIWAIRDHSCENEAPDHVWNIKLGEL